MNEYLAVWHKFAVFSGRAPRREYWMFVLMNFLVMLALSVAASQVKPLVYLSLAYNLAILLPSLGVAIRRLHDTNHSGWWLFIGLVPLVGAVVLVVFLVSDSTPGSNQYGENPKGIAAAPVMPHDAGPQAPTV